MFTPLKESIIKRACENNFISINIVNIRDYAEDPHFADDTVYGGGAGMVMKPEPIINSLRASGWENGDKVIVTTPAGKVFNQKHAQRMSCLDQVFIISGHYEGIDQRVTEITDAEEFSIGDYVLTGGELPAMVIVDSFVRLIDGVLGDKESLEEESFCRGLLEYPQYTRPREYEGYSVPDVLFTGDHKIISEWRRKESIKRTYKNRPDLIQKLPLESTDDDTVEIINEIRLKNKKNITLYIALVHYPVLDPKGHIIATSVTNLDIHDIARTACTYNVKGYYIIQPGTEQKQLTEKIISYWTTGHGSKINPDRKRALDLIHISDSLEDAEKEIYNNESIRPKRIGTSAKIRENIISYQEMRDEMEQSDCPYLLIFGTGHGLTDSVMNRMDYILKPIEGPSDYNHLSVRSAVSITIDRLLGE